jgi:transcriptional regulator with XRE-family HTH domain
MIRQRLSELGLDQKDLAAAADVTESYVSQLLARKKAPPAPGRTDLYEKIGAYLKLPAGELSRLADLQRKDELKKKLTEPPVPLFKECRELVLRKCKQELRPEVQRIFEKETFGELERLVTQTLLDVAQGLARHELRNETWLRSVAQVRGRTYEEMRVAILEFLDTDVFDVPIEGCVAFLDPMIEFWDIDLKTFGIEIVLNRRLAPSSVKRFEFTETTAEAPFRVEPGFEQFLNNKSLSGDVTEDEIEFLRAIRFKESRPSPLYYYRELQSLRDPLHFLPPSDHEGDSG